MEWKTFFPSSFSLFLKIYTFRAHQFLSGRKRVSRRCESTKILVRDIKAHRRAAAMLCVVFKKFDGMLRTFSISPGAYIVTKHKRCRWKTNLKKLLDPSLGRAQSSSHSNDAELDTSVMKKRLIYFRLIKSEGEANDAFLNGKKKQFDVVMSSSSSRAIDEETTHENANINHKNIFFSLSSSWCSCAERCC